MCDIRSVYGGFLLSVVVFVLFLELLGWFILVGLFATFLIYLFISSFNCGTDVARQVFVFTGPATSLLPGGSSASTRACNAKLHGMTKVLPETIAYAAVQARFAMSTMDTWSKEDGHFNYQDFWHAIVHMFDPNDEYYDEKWCIETLAWWDFKVFGVKSHNAAEEREVREITRSKMAAQRKARFAQRKGPAPVEAPSTQGHSSSSAPRRAARKGPAQAPPTPGRSSSPVTNVRHARKRSTRSRSSTESESGSSANEESD